jgi:hypothetical protein
MIVSVKFYTYYQYVEQLKLGKETPKIGGIFGFTLESHGMGSDYVDHWLSDRKKKRLWKTVPSTAKSKDE